MTNAELDAICAEIMGWDNYENDWTPSTDIAQAKMVMDRLVDKYKMQVILVSHWNESGWACFIYPDFQSDKGRSLGEDKTLERAICLAAVKAWEMVEGGDVRE